MVSMLRITDTGNKVLKLRTNFEIKWSLLLTIGTHRGLNAEIWKHGTNKKKRKRQKKITRNANFFFFFIPVFLNPFLVRSEDRWRGYGLLTNCQTQVKDEVHSFTKEDIFFLPNFCILVESLMQKEGSYKTDKYILIF